MVFRCLMAFLTTIVYANYSAAQNCSNASVGLTALSDLGTGEYFGFQGGLYPDGSNVIPQAHLEAGLALAHQIEPLNSLGESDPDSGQYVLLSIGMSAAKQEFEEFFNLAIADPDRQPPLVIVNGAQGSQTSEIISDPDAEFWDIVDSDKLGRFDVTPEQVQIVWLKQAPARPTQDFPQDAEKLQGELLLIVQIIKNRYPNTKIVYLSSRTYGGYATTDLNPEPYAYQSGFAVKWLIEQQINGDPELNFNHAKGEIKAPFIMWGPYLWTDGMGPDGIENGLPGRSDGLEWTCSTQDSDGDGFPDGDVDADGTHPAIAGRIKAASLLLNFVKTDETARIWYLGENPTTVADAGKTHPAQITLFQNYPNPFNPTTTIGFSLAKRGHITLNVFDVLGRKVATLVDAELSPGEHSASLNASGLAAGVYLFRIESSGFSQVRKAILLK